VQVYLRVYTLPWFQSWSILEHVEVWDTLLLACLSLEAVGQEYLVQTSVLSRQLDILLSVALCYSLRSILLVADLVQVGGVSYFCIWQGSFGGVQLNFVIKFVAVCM
jgi:hypothetical protein